MIYPWTGYARDLLQNMFDIRTASAPAWTQAITDSCTDITTDPELQQLVMECLQSRPPSPETAITAFCTLCALFEHFWSGHASLSATDTQAYFKDWLSMQPQVCTELPDAGCMTQWIDTTPLVKIIDDEQCQNILSGTLTHISDCFKTKLQTSHTNSTSVLCSSPVLVRVRNTITTPRLFAIQAEMAQILRKRLESPAFHVPQIHEQDLKNIQIGTRSSELHEAQIKAVQNALAHPLTVITGGPGTGKTSIIQKILELCNSYLNVEPERILLSAPTGKAARRMHEAIQIEGIPAPQTLHRLLQIRPNGISPFHPQRPIQADFIIVDELSMLGFDLAVSLLRAISPDTRLILIGDPEQLPPVDSGNLLEALVSPSLETMTDGLAIKLAQSCVRLTKNYRTQTQDLNNPSNIFTVQNAIMKKDKEAVEVFRRIPQKMPSDFRFKNFEYCDDITQTQNTLDTWAQLMESSWLQDNPGDSLTQVLTQPYSIQNHHLAPDAESRLFKVFTHLEKFRLLTPMNRSSFGAIAFNRYLIHKLHLPIASSHQIPVGCLVLLTQNSYQIQHFNGETGLVIQDENQNKYVAFPSSAQESPVKSPATESSQNPIPPKFDLFSLEQVPQIQPAFAMSVHKSQGSQYDHVLIILSPYPTPLLSANMLYTAISRSKISAALLASPEILPACFR